MISSIEALLKLGFDLEIWGMKVKFWSDIP